MPLSRSATCLLFLLAVLVSPAEGKQDSAEPRAAPALDYREPTFCPDTLQALPGEQERRLREIFETALAAVAAYPPPNRDSLFRWRGDRRSLRGKAFLFRLCNSGDTEVVRLGRIGSRIAGPLPENTDAATMLLQLPGLSDRHIVSYLFLDRLFYDSRKMERTDGFVRCVAALAHEIYGNTQIYLERPLEDFERPEPGLRREMETYSFQAGVDFLLRMRADPALEKFPKILNDLRLALERERKGLENWRSVRPGARRR